MPSSVDKVTLLEALRRRVEADRVPLVAAGVSFYIFLALIPGISVFVSVYGLILDPAGVERQVVRLRGTVPDEVVDFIASELHKLAEAPSASLSAGLLFGVLLVLWSSTKATRGLIRACNATHAETEKRGYLDLNLLALALTAGLFLVLTVSFLVVGGLPRVLPIGGPAAAVMARIAPWLTMALVFLAFVSSLYHFAPNRPPRKLRWATGGALAATLVWLVASAGFSFYVANFSPHASVYGALTGVVILLLWLYLSIVVILAGAELNAVLEEAASPPPVRSPSCSPRSRS